MPVARSKRKAIISRRARARRPRLAFDVVRVQVGGGALEARSAATNISYIYIL